ncbi:MAG: thiopurine S-methyltransferase [Oligoflexales bacterium]
MDKKYWLDCWDSGNIRFHQKKVNPHLNSFWKLLAKDRRPVFVPLCGKTLDMNYLANYGHKVIGVELSEQAIKEFFQGLDLKPQIISDSGFKVYEANSYKIYCGDIFEIKFDFSIIAYVYDRACYIALDHKDRKKYCHWLIKNLPHVNMLHLSIEFDHLTAGPPYSITKQEIERGFSSSFNLECLIDEPISKEKVPHADFITHLTERVHKITPQS